MKKWMISVWCVLALLGCQKDESNNATASAPASAPVSAASGVNQNLPKYRVAVELNAPFAIQMSDGGVSGFDFDLLQKIAERQGFTLEFVPYPVESLLHILEKGEADLMAGGIYFSPEHEEKFEFTNTYLPTGTSLLVNKKTNLQKLTDIQEETIAVTDRSEAEKWVSETILNPAQIKTKPTLWLAFKEGASKNVDVVVGDTASLTYFLKEYPDDSLVLFSENTLPVERFAFMLRKGQPELLRKLNAGLTQLQNEGTVDKLRKQWFEEIKKVEAVPTETTPKTASEPFY